MNHRTAKQRKKEAQQSFRVEMDRISGVLFDQPESIAYLEDKLKSYGLEYRNTFYNPANAFKIFLRQALQPFCSCRQAINKIRKEAIKAGKPVAKTDTGNYCKSRKKIPTELIREMALEVAQSTEKSVNDEWLWYGRHVKVVDGTTIDAPDTPENQKAFPQPSSQEKGLGFPKIRLLGLISLATGCLLNLAGGKYSGKGTGELSLFRRVLNHINARDIMLGDTMFGTYFNLWALMQKGADGIFPIYGGRESCSYYQLSGDKHDRIVEWLKPQRPDWMDLKTYRQIPDELQVREVSLKRKGQETITLVTTLVNTVFYCKKDITNLYKERYNGIELPLRDIKCTMGLDMLTCKKPDMLIKEIWMRMLGYNLVRSTMSKAAKHRKKIPKKLSFKNALEELNDIVRELAQAGKQIFNRLFKYLLETIGTEEVGNQKRPPEIRKNKLRKKCLQLLTKPRKIENERLRKAA